MKHVLDLDTGVVAQILESQFPDLAPACVTRLGEGCDSIAFEVNGSWVFRFPKSADVEAQLDVESRILPRLGSRLPWPIPSFTFHGMPGAGYRHRFAGYRKLPGITGLLADPDRVPFMSMAPRMATFLSALHGFPLPEARRLGLREEDMDRLLDEISDQALARFEVVARAVPAAPLDRWHAYLAAGPETVSGMRRPPAVIHNDLAAEHILLDPASLEVTGVIDWGDIAISDPTIDVAGLFSWGGEPLVRAVLARYSGTLTPRILPTARYIAAAKGVNDIFFGVDMNRGEYLASGVRALDLAIGGPGLSTTSR